MADDAPVAKEREPSVDRVIAFSDGVVAIAITLLVLPLTDIEARPGASGLEPIRLQVIEGGACPRTRLLAAVPYRGVRRTPR
jgi:hypothetical protein